MGTVPPYFLGLFMIRNAIEGLGRIARGWVSCRYILPRVVAVLLLVAVSVAAIALPLGPFASFVVRMGGTPAFAEFIMLSAAAVGSGVAFLSVSKPNASSPDIAVQLAPDAPLPTPSGWTPSNGAPGSRGIPIPPSSVSPYAAGTQTQDRPLAATWCAEQNGVCTYASIEVAAQANLAVRGCVAGTTYTYAFSRYDSSLGEVWNQTITTPSTGGCGTLVGANATYTSEMLRRAWLNCPSGWQVKSGDFTKCTNTSSQCPPGYTLSGSNCNLSNASTVRWPSDGVCQIVRSENSYSFASEDPDCDNPTSQVSINGGSITGTADDGGTFSVVTGADGKTTIEQHVPEFSTQTTTDYRVQLDVPTSGPQGSGQTQVKVLGVSIGTRSGTGTLASSVNQSGQQGACGGSGQPLCGVKIDETGMPSDASLSTEKTAFADAWSARTQAMEGVTNVTNLGFGFEIAWPSQSCSNPSFTVPGGYGVLSPPLCEYLPDIRAAMGWLFGVLAGLAIFRSGVQAIRGS